jgi:hypothetical protein
VKAFERIALLIGVFAAAVGTIYGMWTRWAEPVGPTAFYLSSGLGLMLTFYLSVTRRRIGPAPEDDPLGDIEDIQGDYGFFSPHSWWPLFLAGSAAVMFLGLAVGWWLFAIGVFIAIPALVGWTFEYWKGPHAL